MITQSFNEISDFIPQSSYEIRNFIPQSLEKIKSLAKFSVLLADWRVLIGHMQRIFITNHIEHCDLQFIDSEFF